MADRIIVLNVGRIEQIGTPAEIYNVPASTFVASFMGAPPMNLLEAQVADGAVQLGDDLQICAAPKTQADHITLGIRPEDVELNSAGSIPFMVEIVEELGAHRLLHGRLSGQPFTVHVAKDQQASPGELAISLPEHALRLFDADTGCAL